MSSSKPVQLLCCIQTCMHCEVITCADIIASKSSQKWKACNVTGILPYLLSIVGVRPIEELDAGEGAGELTTTWNPRNGGALVKQEAGVEELDALLLDQAHSQNLALLLIWDQLSGQHLPHTCC